MCIRDRYCPSIEDKINRFAERERHQLFVEPEGWNTVEVYINGFSTSLPEEVQYEALRSIAGFEGAKMFRPGYAIEYDYFPPTQLKYSLETKLIDGLFFAGQINGTTGYEEAACQGLMAGINAHQKTKDILTTLSVSPDDINPFFEKISSALIAEKQKASKLLLRPEIELKDLIDCLPFLKKELNRFSKDTLEQASIQIK